MSQLEEFIKEWVPRINQALDHLLQKDGKTPASLYEAMHYSVLSGGKRIRGLLVLMCMMASRSDKDADLNNAAAAACAIEILHAYSLVHDDLPSIDNDDLRRGRPTTHRAYGEAIAILTGDALQALSFEILAKSYPCTIASPAILALAHSAGADQMVGGQVMDIESEGKTQSDTKTVETIHERKTASLISTACRIGGLIGLADDSRLEALANYGRYIGLAFQVIDDILDMTASAEKLGKTPGKDIKNKKATYPIIVGLDESRTLAQNLITRAKKCLADFGDEALLLRLLADWSLERQS